MLAAGKLDRRITIAERVAGVDATGGPNGAYVPLFEVWASRRVLSGSETIRSGAVTSTVNASFRVRAPLAVDAGMQVIDGDATYMIQAVLPSASTHLDLVCEAAT